MAEFERLNGSSEYDKSFALYAAHGVEIIERFNAIYTDNASAVATLDLHGVYDDELDILSDGTPLADGALLRAKFIDTYLPVFSEVGLELLTLADPGFDRQGRQPQLDPSRPFALAVTIGDIQKFSAAFEAIDEDRIAERFVRTILGQTVGVVRSDYDSKNADLTVNAERLLATVSEVIPYLQTRYPDYHNPFTGIKALTTLTRYVEHYRADTLSDYLGAEKRGLVVEDRDAHGPRDWGLDSPFESLYPPDIFEQKWRAALRYMKELYDKQSPLFDQLFPIVRDDFDSTLAHFTEAGIQTRARVQKFAVLKTLESLWGAYFTETESMHQFGKAIEASRLAHYIIHFGLELNQVPELDTDIDEISIIAARGLIRNQTQQVFEVGRRLPRHQGIDQLVVRSDIATGMEYTLKNVPERAQVLWRKQKAGPLPVPQIEVRITRSPRNQTILLEKDISHRADESGGLGVRLQAIVDKNGVRARVRSAHMAGQPYLNQWLNQAESIQAAAAIMAHVEAEAAPWGMKQF